MAAKGDGDTAAFPAPAVPGARLAATTVSHPGERHSGAAEAAPVTPGLSKTDAEMLLARGDGLLATKDVIAARLFYRRSADAGNGTAALRLGETFDRAFLEQARLGPVKDDPKEALYWYRRARDLGNGDAALLLKNLRRPSDD